MVVATTEILATYVDSEGVTHGIYAELSLALRTQWRLRVTDFFNHFGYFRSLEDCIGYIVEQFDGVELTEVSRCVRL